MYKNILVPLDGSNTAAFGLREAIKLAKDQGATLRLIHVVNELIITAPNEEVYELSQFVDSLRETGKTVLKEAESLARDTGIPVDSVLAEAMGSQAGHEIVQQAKQWPAELIVMGTHGRRGLRRLVMGSDAEFVVRHMPVPVLLVRARESKMA